ncbi:MAG TPA: NAD(P)H-dependent oxidoreductase [Solirubrobacteraceae bacterium]|nr:NAD(P)H-dependent oxidoreductase [Solirubrobacteraceae bacterium]
MDSCSKTILVIETSPRKESASSTAAASVARMLARSCADVVRASQRELPFVPAGLDYGDYPAEIGKLIGAVDDADAVVLAVPVHRYAVAGLARNVVELLGDAIKGKLVLPIVAAGSRRSTLVAQAFQADLLLNFNCRAMRAVLVSPDVDVEELDRRISQAAEQVCSELGVGLGRDAAWGDVRIPRELLAPSGPSRHVSRNSMGSRT